MVNGIREGRVYWIKKESFLEIMKYAENNLQRLHISSNFVKNTSLCVQNSDFPEKGHPFSGNKDEHLYFQAKKNSIMRASIP